MIKAIGICKSYGNHEVLKDLSLKIEDGEFLCINGVSGSGKTTLLNILGFLEKPDCGNMTLDGVKNPTKQSNVLKLQRTKIGYLFQNYGLINDETVLNNLEIALKFKEYNKINKIDLIKKSLNRVNLKKDIINKKIFELSGGEQQRVSMARLILKDPEYIFADEPTGNLDKENSTIIFNILKDMNKEGKTIIMVSHDLDFVEKVDTLLKL